MKALILQKLSEKDKKDLEELYHNTKLVRMRTRAQAVLLSSEHQMKVGQISKIVLKSQATIQRWLKNYQSNGIKGLEDAPKSGAPARVTQAYKTMLLTTVRQRPRSLDQPFSIWTLDRLADYLAEQTGIRVTKQRLSQILKKVGIVMSRPQHKISSPDPEYELKKRRLKKKEIT